MPVVNKKILKQLRRLASQLPEINRVAAIQNKLITGKEAELSGLEPPHNLDHFEPEQEYLFKMPVYATVNHLLRLKKAWKKHGAEGVIGYCENIKAQTEEESLTK